MRRTAPLGVNNHGPVPHEGWGDCGGSHPRKAAAGAGFHGPFAQGAFARRQQSSNTSSRPCKHQGRNRDVRLWFTCGLPVVRPGLTRRRRLRKGICRDADGSPIAAGFEGWAHRPRRPGPVCLWGRWVKYPRGFVDGRHIRREYRREYRQRHGRQRPGRRLDGRLKRWL